MSGPKTSRYTLTAEQRRILAEQRKIERRKAVATETIRRTQKRLLQIGGMFGADKQIAAELIARTGSDNGLVDLLTELSGEYKLAGNRYADALCPDEFAKMCRNWIQYRNRLYEGGPIDGR